MKVTTFKAFHWINSSRKFLKSAIIQTVANSYHGLEQKEVLRYKNVTIVSIFGIYSAKNAHKHHLWLVHCCTCKRHYLKEIVSVTMASMFDDLL